MKLFRKIRNVWTLIVKILHSPRIAEIVQEDWAIRKCGGRRQYYSNLARNCAVECGENLKVNSHIKHFVSDNSVNSSVFSLL